jgi:LPS-assembly lipoprotein
MKKTYLSILLLLSCLLLNACGFHLAGKEQLPADFNDIYVESTMPYSPVSLQLVTALQSRGVNTVDSAENATMVIEISKDEPSNHLETTGASQETRRYTITYYVTFKLLKPTGEKIFGPTTVSSSNTHYVYSGQVFGNNQEEATLYSSLRQEATQKIIFILNSSNVQYAITDSQGEDSDEADA